MNSRDRAVVAVAFLSVVLFACASKVEPTAATKAPPESTKAPLTGEFFISGRTLIDPMPEEPRDTHLFLHLTGESARALFENMKVDATRLACGAADFPEMREKRISDMQCSTDGNRYECLMAINIKEQRIDAGWPC